MARALATPVHAASGESASTAPTEKPGLRFTMEDVESVEAPATAAVSVLQAALASGDAVGAVIDRLPALEEAPTDRVPFALRPESPPPPVTGAKLPMGRAKAEGPAPLAKPSGPLEVVRFAPEGKVELAPHVRLSFSEPMVPLASLAALDRKSVPARMEPELPGTWQWLGTRTLLFQPTAKRLPMATRYVVTVPAGTRSQNGATSKQDFVLRFETPAPRVLGSVPRGGGQPRDPVVALRFDQRVDAEAVLRALSVRVQGEASERAGPALVPVAPDGKDFRHVRRQLGKPDAGTLVAFRFAAKLPGLASIEVRVPAGTPSAEGPERTPAAQSVKFKTYGPLQVRRHGGPWGRGPIRPYSPLYIELTNRLDVSAFDAKTVKIAPEIPGVKVAASGRRIIIRGATKGRTTYTVMVPATLTDRYAQTLGTDTPLTFKIGPARPRLFSDIQGNYAVLDPHGPPVLRVYTINQSSFDLVVRRVEPEDWTRFSKMGRRRIDGGESLPGKLVARKTISVDGKPEELTETRVDLRDAFGKSGARIAVKVKERGGLFSSKRLQSFRVWLERTPFAVDAYADSGQLVVFCSGLKDGAPVAGATVSLLPDGIEGTTGADGTVRLALGSIDRQKRAPVLLVRKGKASTALPASADWWRDDSWRRRPAVRQVRWYVESDRGLYRPGETARVKGWVRLRGPGPKGDLQPATDAIERLSYWLHGTRGNEIQKGEVALDPMGGFDLKLEIPLTANLGFARLQLNAQVKGGAANAGHGLALRVEEFRRPEFEVTLGTSEGPHLVGGRARAEVSARYFSGGPLGGAKVSWRVTASPGRYVPPGRSDFTFGRTVPWWEPQPDRWANRRTQHRSSRTDSRGKAAIALALLAATPPRAHTLEIEATVFDVNRQPFAAKKTLVVHPSARYVGVRADRTFVQKGQPMRFEAIVSDLDGNLQAKAPIDLKVVRLDWEQKAGRWTQTEKEVARARLESAAKAARWSFTAKEGGSFRLVARTVDDRDRPNETVLRFWVAGGERPPSRKLTEEKLTLIPERETVRPGEEVRLLVQSPFFPAEGIATLERDGIASVKRFRMTGPSHTLFLVVPETALPNVWVRVDLVGAAKRADAVSGAAPLRPAFAHARLNVKVSTEARKLAVTVTPRDTELEPGAKTTVQLSVRDALGAPVAGAEVCLVVVDEAVLSLLGYRLPDPLGVFYPSRSSGVSSRRSRSHVVLARPEELLAQGAAQPPPMASPAPGGAMQALGGAPRRLKGMRMEAEAADGAAPGAETRGAVAGGPAIKLRKDLSALAGFFPAIRTAADGTASVEVKLPDSLTRYRLMAVATGGAKRYGHAEATVVARLPLMARPAFPRFLRFGDRCELGVLLQNRTDRPLEALALMRATNLTVEDQDGPVGKKVTVPARGRVEVRFRVAAEQAGTARVQVAVVAGRFADAETKQIPVWTPATAEAFATYGQLDTDDPIAYQVVTPLDAVPEHGGLEVSVATTQLQALTDAVLYLAKYPFGCSEQLASRILAVVALRDVLDAFHAAGLPQKKKLVAAMQRDLKTLAGRQDYSGGFGLWRKGDRVWPYASVHAAHALVRAEAKGYDVSKRVLRRTRNYLRRIRRYIPKVYGLRARISIEAYALYVRALLNDRDPDAARRLVREVGADKLPVEAAGWLLTVFGAGTGADALWRVIQNRVEETADAAQVTTSTYGKEGYLLFASDRRADAVVLDALTRVRPGSDLIPKLVRGLLKHRKRGRWSSTQENAFCLLALYEYFHRFEKVAPDLVARVWLGKASAGEQAFKGRQTETRTVRVPMAFLKQGQATRELLLQRTGKGRLYYRVGLRYAPATLELPPVERGFTVTRRYLAIDDPADVRRDEKGVWHVKAGARVRVELTMVAPARRYHVALVDPLPAGLEAVNPGLLGSRSAPPAKDHQKRWAWWTWRWFEHQNLRDDRAEAFSSLLWEGVYRYRYVAQATTLGRFVASPPKAEEMYSPETFGRGRTDVVVVE